MGAVINANIFGELAVIMASMGKADKEFQKLYANTNSVLQNLNIGEKTCINIRNDVMRNQPSLVSQNELEDFLEIISPSIKLKILMFQYKQILSGVKSINENNKGPYNDLMETLIYKIELFSMEPEM